MNEIDYGWSFGWSWNSMSNDQWDKSGMTTYASALCDNGEELIHLFSTKTNASSTFGEEHAEDVFLREIGGFLTNIPLLKGKKRLILCLSKSPCTRCAPKLMDFVQNWHNGELTIIVRGLYAGGGRVEDSQASVDAMRSAGIVVSSDVRSYNARTERFEVDDRELDFGGNTAVSRSRSH